MSTATNLETPKTRGHQKQKQSTLPTNQKSPAADPLTEKLQAKLASPVSSPEFDLHAATNDVLKDVGLTTADAGGKISFQGADPILSSTVANRLQAALYREMLYLVEQGVLSVEETDAAVCYGPGLRWGVMGQSLQWHVGGGAGGIKHFMEHLMDPLAGMMKVIGNPQITPELKQTIIEGVNREAANRSVDELAQEENKLIVGYLAIRAKAGIGELAKAA